LLRPPYSRRNDVVGTEFERAFINFARAGCVSRLGKAALGTLLGMQVQRRSKDEAGLCLAV